MTLKNYKNDKIYKALIDGMVSFIRGNDELKEVEYISGGERRDWFFSLIIADLLHKPHITMFKDLSSVCYCKGDNCFTTDLKSKKILHIADIITEASSYTNQWIPAAHKKNGEIKWSLVVVDRLQGGAENLKAAGVKSYALVEMDKSLFEKAFSLGYIDKDQYNTVIGYMDDPTTSMRKFLLEHPEFIEEALKSDEKTSSRAKMCLENDFYNLKNK
jgi:orotate phosphoribosyltransferase